MKTRIKKIEWEEQKPTFAKGATVIIGWLNDQEYAEIQARHWDDEGNPNRYECYIEGGCFAGSLEDCKEWAQNCLEKWWAKQVELYTEPVPFQVTMITEGPK